MTRGAATPVPPGTPPGDLAVRGRGRRRRLVTVALAVLGVLLLGTAAGLWFSPIGERWRADAAAQPPATGVDTVAIVDSTFQPAAVAVPVGTTVTWRWTDGEAHDVVYADGPASAVQSAGTWSRTFDAPGEYPFSCTLHLFMDGRVVVTAP